MLFPDKAFGLGVAYGIAENLVGSVYQILTLAKNFILADIWDHAHEDPGWRIWRYGDHWEAQLIEYALPETINEAHRQREAILRDLKYAFQHPGEFFGKLGDSYVRKYHRFVTEFSKGTATGLFEAGRIAGELILDILAIIGVAEAALKFAAKIPELAKIAGELTRPLELRRPIIERGSGSAEPPTAGTEPGGSTSGPQAPVRTRLPQDIAVDPKAPDALPLNRPIGLNNPNAQSALARDIADAQAQGATDIRVNQQQVNALGERVGVNRPDLQYSVNGDRTYIEYDRPSSTRGLEHLDRLLANDPQGTVILRTVPEPGGPITTQTFP